MKTKHYLFLLLPVISLLPTPAFPVTPKVSIGYYHALLLKNDGSVWAWGNNGAGQLGIGNKISTTTPTVVAGLTDVVDIVAHGFFSMAAKADGTVWVWGDNSYDLSGEPTIGGIYRTVPTQVTALHSIVSVAASWTAPHTAFAVTDYGQVWAWGDGHYGKLGNGRSDSNSGTPLLIPGLTNVVKVSATSAQAVALRSDGTSLGWGEYHSNGDNLRLGLNADGYVTPSVMNIPQLSFLEAVDINIKGLYVGIDTQGKVLAWGDTASGVITCNQIHPGDIGKKIPYYPEGLGQIQKIAGGLVFLSF